MSKEYFKTEVAMYTMMKLLSREIKPECFLGVVGREGRTTREWAAALDAVEDVVFDLYGKDAKVIIRAGREDGRIFAKTLGPFPADWRK